MSNNRLFLAPRLHFNPDDDPAFSDVTLTAREFGFIFQLHVESAFLSTYQLSNLAFDDDGVHLVGHLVHQLEAALFSPSAASVQSHGKVLSLDFRLTVVPRHSSNAVNLVMRTVFGPCDCENPAAYVVRARPSHC
jgi:hypothetical protein